MPGGLGAPELIIVLLVFVLLFGARKLPDLGASVGKSIKNFKKGMAEAKDEDEEVVVTDTTATTTRTEERVPPTTPPTA